MPHIRLYELRNIDASPRYRDLLKEFAVANYGGVDIDWTKEEIEFLIFVDECTTIHSGPNPREIVGLLVMVPYDGNKVHIMLIAIDKDYRRRGLGTELLTYVASKYYNKKVTLNVAFDKIDLLNFYCGKGYAVAKKVCLEQNIVTLYLNHVKLLARLPLTDTTEPPSFLE